MLGLASTLTKGGASLLTFVKDNLKLYLDFKSSKSNTLKFPSEGSTSFDGSDDYIDCGSSSTLKTLGNSSFSFSAWINSDLDSSDDYIFSNSTGTDKGILGRVTSANKFRVLVLTNGSVYDGAESSVLSSGWNHVASSWDGSTMRIYINGTEDITRVNQGTLGDATSINNFQIGRLANDSKYFSGKMANLAIWSRALEPEEIQSIMNKSYSQLKGVEKTSLVSWWALDSSTTGSNLIADSGFDDANYWSAGSGWSVNGTTASKAVGADVWSVLQVSNLLKGGVTYRFTADVRRLSGIGLFRFYAQSNFGANIYPYESNGDNLATYTQDLVSNTDGNPAIRIGGSALSIEVDNFTVQELNIHTDSHGSNNGSNIGATINSNVYGGNAPILPRAVDVAKEGQADAIGDGSAYFVKSNATYIQTNNHNLLVDGNATMTCWAKATVLGQEQFFGGHHNQKRFYFGISSTNQPFFGVQDMFNNAGANLNISANEWNHYAIVANGGTATYYLNGIAHHSTSYTQASATNPDNPFVIGARNDGGTGAVSVSNHFDGYISQYGLWQGALTQAQIQSVMESTSYSKIPADVKSTLGAERVLNSDFSDGENLWTLNNANVVNKVLEIDEGAFSYYAQQSVDGGGSAYRQFESGYLMKL